MAKEIDWVVVGRFGRPHGVKGFIIAHSFTEPRDNLIDYKDWHAYINNLWRPIQLLALQSQQKHIIVKVEGYLGRDEVAALTNIDIGINREQLPLLKPGEYYWHELEGKLVVNQQGITLGKVSEILATGANDVLVVRGEKQYLIPYLPGIFIFEITKEMIQVDWDIDF